MSGVAVVKYLLASAGAITSLVPAARIMAGDAPLAMAKPLIVVSEVDGFKIFRSIRTSETGKLRRERVQVSVLVNDYYAAVPGLGYPQVKTLLRLMRTACENKRGTINGVAVESITDEGEGPDLSNEEIHLASQSNDFFVNWVE